MSESFLILDVSVLSGLITPMVQLWCGCILYVLTGPAVLSVMIQFDQRMFYDLSPFVSL